MAQYLNYGQMVDYTPSADVAVGAVVVQGQLIGVAVHPLIANRLGALAVKGVFSFPKSTAASSALSAGAKVYWDATNGVVTATVGSNVYVGKVVAAAVDGDSAVKVMLIP